VRETDNKEIAFSVTFGGASGMPLILRCEDMCITICVLLEMHITAVCCGLDAYTYTASVQHRLTELAH